MFNISEFQRSYIITVLTKSRLQHELELISIYVLFHKTAQSLLTIAFDSVQQLA